MKRNFLILLLGVLVWASCGTPGSVSTPASDLIQPTETAMAFSTASPSLTNIPTKTTIPATATLDFASLPTLTPQAPSTCPDINPKARFQVGSLFKNKKEPYHDVRQATLDFLNNGGDPYVAVQKLGENGVSIRLMDLTHDGIKELLVESGYLTIFGCAQGKYTSLLDMEPRAGFAIPLVIQDLNKNGILEIIVAQANKYYDWGGVQQFLQFADYSILEWDGKQFTPLIDGVYDSKGGSISIRRGILKTAGHSRASTSSINGNWSLEDLDNNGLKDFIVLAGIDDSGDSKQLEEKVILKWDGKNYWVSETSIEATPMPSPTHTPHPFSAICDFKAPELRYTPPQTAYPETIQTAIADFLNAGGNPELLKSYYDTTIKDLNNDSLSDILVIYNKDFLNASMYLFACKKGSYKNLLSYKNDGADFLLKVMMIKDINQNKLAEVIIKASACGLLECNSVYIFEWKEESFESIVKENNNAVNYASTEYPLDIYLKDTDKDIILELIWTGGIPPSNSGDYAWGAPWRVETHVYKWDGEYYAEQPTQYSDPLYRFQAVQDADRATILGKYADALSLYQKVIFSDGLEGWSPEKQKYLQEKTENEILQTGKVIATPIPDPNERIQLSTYAYFREMLIYLLTGKPEEAQKNYDTLLRNYAGENPAAPYTEMATVFWTEYQKAQSLANACKAAIDFASQHLSILKPLGSDYHGMQSHTYKPTDICPFK